MLGQVDLMVGPHVSNFMKFMLEELASPQSLSSFIYSPNYSSVIPFESSLPFRQGRNNWRCPICISHVYQISLCLM